MKKKRNSKKEIIYKSGQLLKVYKGTTTLEQGAVVRVLDRDPEDNSYLVSTLEAIGEMKGNTKKLFKSNSTWVKSDRIEKIDLRKPKKLNFFKRNSQRLQGLILGLVLGSSFLWIEKLKTLL